MHISLNSSKHHFLNMATPEEEVERDMQLLEEAYMYLTQEIPPWLQ